MNKPVYLRLSIFKISKIGMYEFCYDYIRPRCNEKSKLCCMETDSFLVHISNNELKRPLPKGKTNSHWLNEG